MLKVSHDNTFYFLRYAHLRYVKSFFIDIQKQQNMLKMNYFLRNLQTLQVYNSIIFRITNAKFSGYCFYINTNR